MLIVAMVAAVVIASHGSHATNTVAQTAGAALAPQSHHIGETLDYSLHGEISQTVVGNDVFGRSINQTTAPTVIKGHENISITGLNASSLSLQRSGEVTAFVPGAKPFARPASGWTTVDIFGAVLQDKGKLGGLFLLPVAFLGEQAVNRGNALQIGDRWSAQLGTKLYGMLGRPMLHFSVTGQRTVLGVDVYSIVADGDVKMKEPVLTAMGEALGFATGSAHITAQADYDRINHRLVSLQFELTDVLHYTGAGHHVAGRVKDHQRYLVALDDSSMANGQHATLGSDPAADTPQDPQPAP